MQTHQYDFNEFVSRVGHQALLEKFQDNIKRLPTFSLTNGPWLCGGAVRDVIAGRETDTDWDIFCHDEKQIEYIAGLLTLTFGEPVEKPNNLTFSKDGMVVQVIRITTYATLVDVLDSFDFTICQFGYAEGRLVVGEFSLFDLCRKRLALHKLTYGVSTLRRLMKYSKKGFTVCSGVLADILSRTVEDPTTVNPNVVSVD